MYKMYNFISFKKSSFHVSFRYICFSMILYKRGDFLRIIAIALFLFIFFKCPRIFEIVFFLFIPFLIYIVEHEQIYSVVKYSGRLFIQNYLQSRECPRLPSHVDSGSFLQPIHPSWQPPWRGSRHQMLVLMYKNKRLISFNRRNFKRDKRKYESSALKIFQVGWRIEPQPLALGASVIPL